MIVWRPQPGPQAALLEAGRPRTFIDELFFGGARGGGKTDGMLGEFAAHQQRHGRHAHGIMFRRELPQLDEAIARSKEIYAPLGATWHAQSKTWRFPSGATLRFRHLDRDSDAEKYQGHSYTRVYFEELTNFPSPAPYLKMFGVLRSPAGVPCGMRATGNPGGPGHNWCKARFIDPAPPMRPVVSVVDGQTMRRVFIASRLDDNPRLTSADPLYRARLQQTGSEALVRAWLEGDWDIVAGGMFDDVWDRDVHVVEPFDIPRSWRIDRAFDWGSTRPFAVGWWAESDGTGGHGVPVVPARTVYLIGEWYGWTGRPDEGLRMVDAEIARGILQREEDYGIAGRVSPGPADSSIFDRLNGDSTAATMARVGGSFYPADKSPGSRVRGWQTLRQRLNAALQSPMEQPGLFIFNRCTDGLLRTLPAAPRDGRKIDDVDTTSEDHALDMARYRLATRHVELPDASIARVG